MTWTREQARGQASQSHVSSVQAMVIEKADKILAEKSRFAVQGRRGSDPGIGSLAEPGGGGSSGGVGVVKLDLDLLRAASNSSTPAPDAGSAAGDSGGRQSELSNVMQVLSGAAGGARSGERKLAKGPAGKGDRRARVELLKDKVLPAPRLFSCPLCPPPAASLPPPQPCHGCVFACSILAPDRCLSLPSARALPCRPPSSLLPPPRANTC